MATFSFRTQARVARWLANLALVVLVIYLGVTLARVTWLMAWNERPVAASLEAQGLARPGGTGPLSGSLAGYEFFGRPEGESRVAEVVRRSAPETGLKLRLEGVLLAERPEDSGAIVAGSNGETEHYRVGDSLPGNAELAEVEEGRILIRRGGRYESLAFDEESGFDSMVAEDSSEPAESSPDEFLASAREQLDSQGAEALATYGLAPADDGGSSGYVYDGSNAMLNAVNLRAGDVITAINGQRLGDIEQDKALLDSWRSEPQLEIEVERDGSLLTVSYAIPEQWR
ncbi:type II secretion system protein N [Marinobacter sp.]|uniref:type II secretion system protein N n=1 Tax=Marinobacter sp. TaxID=50741 RepID=UPI0034A2494F